MLHILWTPIAGTFLGDLLAAGAYHTGMLPRVTATRAVPLHSTFGARANACRDIAGAVALRLPAPLRLPDGRTALTTADAAGGELRWRQPYRAGCYLLQNTFCGRIWYVFAGLVCCQCAPWAHIAVYAVARYPLFAYALAQYFWRGCFEPPLFTTLLYWPSLWMPLRVAALSSGWTSHW